MQPQKQAPHPLSASRNRILSCPCIPFDCNLAIDYLRTLILSGAGGYTVAVNFEKIMMCQRDLAFREIVERSVMPYPDGIGAVLPLRILHRLICERIDVPMSVIEVCLREKRSLMLLGGVEGVHQDAARELRRRHPGITVVGGGHGFMGARAYEELIAQYSPDVVLLGVGSPYQEALAARLSAIASACLIVPCGGALDIAAGHKERAPSVWRRLNLEWLWRVLKEPRRIIRLRSFPVYFGLLCIDYFRLRLTRRE